jgi:hypothetical protein
MLDIGVGDIIIFSIFGIISVASSIVGKTPTISSQPRIVFD